MNKKALAGVVAMAVLLMGGCASSHHHVHVKPHKRVVVAKPVAAPYIVVHTAPARGRNCWRYTAHWRCWT